MKTKEQYRVDIDAFMANPENTAMLDAVVAVHNKEDDLKMLTSAKTKLQLCAGMLGVEGAVLLDSINKSIAYLESDNVEDYKKSVYEFIAATYVIFGNLGEGLADEQGTED